MASSPLNESDIFCEFDGLLDFNNEGLRKRFFQTASEFFLVRIGFPIVWLIGLPANLAFIYTIYKVSHMRTITNFYLANLALADICCLALYPGLYSWSYYATPVVFNFQTSSWLECAALFFSFDIPNFASNAVVSLVALERFYAICRPLQSRRASSPGRATALLVVSWSVSVALALSVSMRFTTLSVYCVLWPDADADKQYDSLPDTVSFCTAGEPWIAVYAHCLYVIVWVLGLVLNSFLYYKIVRKLGRRTVSRSASTNDTKSRQVRNQVARMLIVNSAVFFVLQAPRVITINLLSFLTAATGQVLQPSDVPFLVPVTYFLSLLNSAINPIIYNGTNSRYRQAFLQAFGCACRRGKEDAGQPSVGDMTVSSKVTEKSKSEENLGDLPNASI